MLKLLAFGIAVGAGVQAWRQWPADGPVTASAGVVVSVVAVLAAYLAGRWHGRHGSASASASAVSVSSAESSAVAQQAQTVNVALLMPGHGAGSAAGGVRVPDEAVSWFGSPRAEITGDELEGMDLTELLDQAESERA